MRTLIAKLKQYPIGVVGFILTLVIGTLLMLRGDVLSELEQQASDLDLQVQVIDFNAVSAINLDQQLQAANDKVAEINERLMDSQRRTANLRYFLALEERLGVGVSDPFPKGTTPANPSGGVSFAKTSYSMTLRGSLEQVLDFVYVLRTGPYVVSIDTVTLSGGTTGTEVSLRIDFRILSKG